jgi:ribosomal protein L3
MSSQVIGTKLTMTQRFDPQGQRVVVTKIKAEPKQKLGSLFQLGDLVKVTGWSKGKGFTGVIKRWGFKGGPRTHGQSDRERAPGSIGQGTDPGRVFPGKKMAGRAGGQRVTIRGLKVFAVDEKDAVLSVTGPVPGPRGGKLIVTSLGIKKKVTKSEAAGTEKPEEKEKESDDAAS